MKAPNKRSKYLFNIVWSKIYLGLSINEIHKEKFNIPLTTLYFWPREDGWKLLKAELDSKPWLTEKPKLEILNNYSLIINYWLKNKDKNINIQNLQILNLNINILSIN